MTKLDAFKFARIAAHAADEKIGENIVAFDVRKQSSLADCYLLVTGSTHIHIRAIEDAMREALREAGADLKRTDGRRGHLWRVLDYGFLIIHVMDQKSREFYAMEKLWERGKLLALGIKQEAKPEKKPRPRKKPTTFKRTLRTSRTKRTNRVKRTSSPKKTTRPKKKR